MIANPIVQRYRSGNRRSLRANVRGESAIDILKNSSARQRRRREEASERGAAKTIAHH